MTQGKTHREPLLRIAKRDGIARPKAWAIRIIAVLLSLVCLLYTSPSPRD